MKKNNRKKTLVALLSVTLAVVLTAGTSMAYYSATADEAVNKITVSKDIRAKLTEPNWNAEEGMKLVPGKKIKKDPMVTNSCEIPEYAAIKLTFQKADKSTMLSQAEFEKLIALISIDWNVGTASDNWQIIQGENTPQIIYMYNRSLAPGEISKALFNSITIKTKAEGLNESDLRWLQGIKLENGRYVSDPGALGGFNVKVDCSAIQSEGFAGILEAKDELISLCK